MEGRDVQALHRPGLRSEVVDVVGLCLNSPERAAVFSFDEKTQVQALDRTQPSLPLTSGRTRTMTHVYKRNGTVDLFAALSVGTGEVLHQTRRRHTAQDVLAFFRWIDLHTPPHLDVHVEFPRFPDWSGLGSCHLAEGGVVAETVLDGAEVVEGGVPPFGVVEPFGVFEHGLG
jgi:hypothetical protein